MTNFKKPSLSQKLGQTRQPYMITKPKSDSSSSDKYDSDSSLKEAKSQPGDSSTTISTSKYRLKKWARLIIICFEWCQWAENQYKINIHRFISFAHITDNYKSLEDLHFDFLQHITAQKRRAQMTSPELQSTRELLERGRVRAEMMNFDVNYFKLEF